jgi:hypothetical protein
MTTVNINPPFGFAQRLFGKDFEGHAKLFAEDHITFIPTFKTEIYETESVRLPCEYNAQDIDKRKTATFKEEDLDKFLGDFSLARSNVQARNAKIKEALDTLNAVLGVKIILNKRMAVHSCDGVEFLTKLLKGYHVIDLFENAELIIETMKLLSDSSKAGESKPKLFKRALFNSFENEMAKKDIYRRCQVIYKD